MDLRLAGEMIAGADGRLDLLHSDLEITLEHFVKIFDPILNREEI